MKKIRQNILLYTLTLIGMSGILLATAESPEQIGLDPINYIGMGMLIISVFFGRIANRKGWINLPEEDNKA